MKIIISESQLKRLVTEVGGYDDKNVMYAHAQGIQEPIFRELMNTVEIIASYLKLYQEGGLKNKQMIQTFISNLSLKIADDIDMIEYLSDEIYLDDDFKDLVIEYKMSLKRLENYCKLLYSKEISLSHDMSKDELANTVLKYIGNLESTIEKMGKMFHSIHRRYRNRLGIN